MSRYCVTGHSRGGSEARMDPASGVWVRSQFSGPLLLHGRGRRLQTERHDCPSYKIVPSCFVPLSEFLSREQYHPLRTGMDPQHNVSPRIWKGTIFYHQFLAKSEIDISFKSRIPLPDVKVRQVMLRIYTTTAAGPPRLRCLRPPEASVGVLSKSR